MQTDIITIGLGFIEGFALILSPCILPILPIIFAGSLNGSKKRPYGIMIGFISAFALFTFFSRRLVLYTGIDLNVIRHISFSILLFLGVIMLSTYLTEKFSHITRTLSNAGATSFRANDSQGGFLSGIAFGGLIAIIWTPCAGPILAAVIVQTVIQKTNFMSLLVLGAFAMGAAAPMLIITLFGRKLMMQFTYFKMHTVLFRKILGALIVLSVMYMLYLEGAINMVHATKPSTNVAINLEKGLLQPYRAPKLGGINSWINSPPLVLNQLQGKVILIDFWTYSCINCVRTLPYLNDWYQKYHDKGLVIIGVHTPEFDFEKNTDNVKRAVEQDQIKYPVALDSQFVTWQNFNNQYWPAHYLIDKNGYVVYTHFGEGEYDVTENNIRYLLGMADPTVTTTDDSQSYFNNGTPETYLGYNRALHFSSSEAVTKNQSAHYTFPKNLSQNDWALQGKWKILADRIISNQINAAIEIHFKARKVFMVMGNATNKTIQAKLFLNGKSITAHQGKDSKNSTVHVGQHSIYEVIALEQSEEGILSVVASEPGLEIYTFTFSLS